MLHGLFLPASNGHSIYEATHEAQDFALVSPSTSLRICCSRQPGTDKSIPQATGRRDVNRTTTPGFQIS